jgi:threonine dehydratase
LVRELIDETIVVTEDEIASAIVFAYEEHRLVVEGGGAVGLAALLHGRVRGPGREVAVVISGGNIALSLLHALSGGASAG